MVPHENKGIQIKVILLLSMEQVVHKLLVISVADKYLLPPIAPAGDMIKTVFTL